MQLRPTCYLLLVALAIPAFSACRGSKLGQRLRGAKPTGEREMGSDTVVLGGTIRLVRDSLGFVLIQSTGAPPPKGSQLFVHRSGEQDPVAQLQVSPEVKTGFVVADILSGSPAVGDMVMWSLPSASAQPESGTPDLPEVAPPTFDDIPPLTPSLPLDPAGGAPAALPVSPEDELEREIRSGGGVPIPPGG